ncbi:serine hydrolase domain-containing protein [Kribbella koreensis]|uniref:Serine hydrolase domain-containing protein n=1 Tax=Kribbella koreensis TaxID=57909 RepID=A0ABN1PD53_9ACTN
MTNCPRGVLTAILGAALVTTALATTTVATTPPATAALAASAPVGGASVARAGGELQRDVDAIRATGAVGVQARVSNRSGTTTAVSGVADLRTGAPVPANGFFRTGSSTKTFVATVILQLVGERKVSLDDSVERWLPGVVRGNGNDGRRITVRNLLQHTSGIHDDIPSPSTAVEYYAHRYDVVRGSELVRRAMTHLPDFQPGKGWNYSNTGYVLLSMITERATGHSWYAEVQARIIRPLGLRDTYWPGLGAGVRSPHANGYQIYPGQNPTDVTIGREAYMAGGAGGFVTTTADQTRFFQALVGGRLLRPAQLTAMQQTIPVAGQLAEIWPGARDGLGLFSRPLSCGGVYWTHNGDILGYMTRNAFTPDGRSAVVSVSTERQDSVANVIAQDRATGALIDHALCTNH